MEYPKPRWDLENDVLRLEEMIHLYQEEIQKLEVENEELQQKVKQILTELDADIDKIKSGKVEGNN